MNLDSLKEAQKNRLNVLFQMNARPQLEMFYNTSKIAALKVEYDTVFSLFKSTILDMHTQFDLDMPSVKTSDLYADNMEEFRLKVENIKHVSESYRKAIDTMNCLMQEYNNRAMQINPELMAVIASAERLLKPDQSNGNRRKYDKGEDSPAVPANEYSVEPAGEA